MNLLFSKDVHQVVFVTQFNFYLKTVTQLSLAQTFSLTLTPVQTRILASLPFLSIEGIKTFLFADSPSQKRVIKILAFFAEL